MRIHRRRILGFALFLLVFISSTFADKAIYYAAETTDSGVAGEVQWEIADGTLTFSAVENTSGKMKDYSKTTNGNAAPWMSSEAIDSVENIVVTDSITELGTGIYELDNKLKSVKIAGSVKEIPEDFITAGDIELVEIEDGVEVICSGAFWARVYEVTIPESVDTIGLYAFSASRDVAETYLTKANVYKNSTADHYISTYNAYVSESRREGTASDGLVYKHLEWSDGLNDYYDNGTILISYLGDASEEQQYYEVRIDQKDIGNVFCTSSVEGKTRQAEYIKNDTALNQSKNKFQQLYSEENLVTFNLTLRKTSENLNNEKCTIKVEIPEKWLKQKEEVKVITLTQYGTDEIPTIVTSELVTESDVSYLIFETSGSGAFALLLENISDVDDEDDSEDTEIEDTETEVTEETENTETEDTEANDSEEELDDTPKTGMGMEPLLIASLCLALVGTGILLIAKRK